MLECSNARIQFKQAMSIIYVNIKIAHASYTQHTSSPVLYIYNIYDMMMMYEEEHT